MALSFLPLYGSDAFVITKAATSTHIFPLALVYDDPELSESAAGIKKLLNSTGVVEAVILQEKIPTTKKEMDAYRTRGYSAVLFMQPDADAIAWRLYDTTQSQMLLGKKTGSSSHSLLPRLIADAVYTHLFNHDSYFFTKIAYIKKSPSPRHPHATQLCVLDPVDGSSQVILKDPRTLVAPQWNFDANSPVWLTVSEFTPQNVRLLGVDLLGNSWKILDNEGTCVGAARKDDTSFVYVRSGVLWLYTFDKAAKKGKHTRITPKEQVCACPSLLASGDIIYASGSKIYRYDSKEKKQYPLPIKGSCIAPDAHAATGRILFSRAVNGVLQIHTVDSAGQHEQQITFGPGNKVDACWSACGNYMVYTRCQQGKEQIALFNCLTGTERILTPESVQAGYPCWSQKNSNLCAI